MRGGEFYKVREAPNGKEGEQETSAFGSIELNNIMAMSYSKEEDFGYKLSGTQTAQRKHET